MKLDDLRSILLSERETGRLTATVPDLFEKGHAELSAITKKVYSFEDPFSDEARALIDETLAIRQTLQDIFSIRSRKIIALTILHAEGDYYDRDEVKRMIPTERAMFEEITKSIELCQDVLLRNAPAAPRAVQAPAPAAAAEEFMDDEEAAAPFADEETTGPAPAPAAASAPSPLSHPCSLVRVLADMDSFMGVDGRIYTLSKGDIVTLPERNAAVLSERNIVLNINLCK